MGRWINAAEALRDDPLVDLFDPPGATLVADDVPEPDDAPPAPAEWRPWLGNMFPASVKHPFAPHHATFWDHIWGITPGASPRPFIGVWPREGGKSTNVELACVALGCRGVRKYVVYVRETQERADDSVGNIGAKLEAASVERYYPAHSRKAMSKFGSARGWRRNRLWTAGGFTVDAFGLDASGRGAKLGDQRPDLIIFDDLDTEKDNIGVTMTKIVTLTTALLPAGAENCAIIGIQNLIIADGIFTRLVDGRADFLSDRIVSGPFPAIYGLKYEPRENPESKTTEYAITEGAPTWAGQSLEVCQRNMNRWGLTSFLREAQHQVKERREGLALNFDEAEHFVDLTRVELLDLIALDSCFGGLDFGSWRFGFTAWAANEHGVAHRWGEVFSQREELKVRAHRIHALCESVGIVKGAKLLRHFPMWGDAANPTDITELNAAWRAMGSPLRCVAIAQNLKARRTAVDRINEKLGENALKLVRTVGATDRWLLGYNAGSAGTPMTGSRLVWEIGNWSYPVPAEGKVDVKQDPDDHTADGADMIASARYALMSWWRAGRKQDPGELDAFAPATLAADAQQRYTLKGRRQRAKLSNRGGYGDE